MYYAQSLRHYFGLKGHHPGGFKALTFNYLVYKFATGMIGTFGALFIYQLGNDFQQGMLFLLGYFCVQRIFIFLSIRPVGRLLSEIGYRRTMLLGLVSHSVKIFLLAQVALGNIWLLLPAMVLGGIHVPAYYLTYHGIFLDDNDDAKIGEQTGYLEMVGRIASLISPFISGIIISLWGFSAMFNVSVALVIVSILPVLNMKHHKHHGSQFTTSNVIAFFKGNKNVMASSFSWYFTAGIQDVFFPVYLFSVLKSYKVFGSVGSLVMIFGSIAVYMTGKLYDKERHKKLFVGSTGMVSISWIFRFVSVTPVMIIISDVVNRLFSPPWWMKIRRKELIAGETADSLVFGAAHEYTASAAYVFAWSVAFLILILSGGNWILLGIPAVLGTVFATYFVRNE